MMCCSFCNPGMCSKWELNQQPLDWQVRTQSTELYQPGVVNFGSYFLKILSCCHVGFFFFFLLFNVLVGVGSPQKHSGTPADCVTLTMDLTLL